MQIHLDHHSAEPIYRRIVEAIKFKVSRGKLTEGDRLPSLRELANSLRINMRTVVEAYEELCYAGLAVMQQGGACLLRLLWVYFRRRGGVMY